MYIPVLWKDRVVQYPRRVSVTDLGNGLKQWTPAPGDIEEHGTQQSERNFGNMDMGTLEAALISAQNVIHLRQAQASIDNLIGQNLTATLHNSLKYPATNGIATVALPQMLNTLNYQVTAEVVEADGPVEYVEAYDKALNAFKVAYAGSARNVTLKLHVSGGMC